MLPDVFVCVFVEFAADSREFRVREPEDGSPPTPVTLRVQRSGGTVGVVSVAWQITTNAQGETGSSWQPCNAHM